MDGLANGRQHRPRPPHGIGLGDRCRQRSPAAQSRGDLIAPRGHLRIRGRRGRRARSNGPSPPRRWAVDRCGLSGPRRREPTSRRPGCDQHRDDGEEGHEDRAATHGRPRRSSSTTKPSATSGRNASGSSMTTSATSTTRRASGRSGRRARRRRSSGRAVGGSRAVATPARRRGSTSRADAAHRARCWRGRSTTTRRGRCSTPARGRRPPGRAPPRRRVDRGVAEGPSARAVPT